MAIHQRRTAAWLLPVTFRPGRLACAALAGSVLLPLAGCAAGRPAAGGPHDAAAGVAARPRAAAPAGGRTPAGVRTTGSGPAAARPPKYFADIMQWVGAGVPEPLEVRAAATGRLVAVDDHLMVTDVAALAGGRSFVIAEPAGNTCATRLFRIRLNDQGQPGSPSPLPIRRLHGDAVSLAASANGHVIGLAIGGCDKGSRGYLAVAHVRSGRVRRWGGLNLGGVTRGNVALNGGLSMSANGRLLAFPALRLSATSKITGQALRVLRTGAPAGTVARRSRIVRGRRYPPYWPLPVAAELSPGGGTLYSCAALRPAGRAVRIAAYRWPAGQLLKVLAGIAVRGSALPVAGHCPMALDRRGQYLLAPFSVRYPRNPAAMPVLRIALLAVRSGRVRILKVRLAGGSGGTSPLAAVSIAW